MSESRERPLLTLARRRLFIGIILLFVALLFEASARLVYAFRDELRAVLPSTLDLHEYQEPDPRFLAHWRLRPGFRQTVAEALAVKRATGRVIGAQHLARSVKRGRILEPQIFVEVNRDGFRGPEIDASHARPRVLTIGDSCTFGFGTVEELTYAKAIQRHLAVAGLKAEVVNAGVEGYSPRNVLLRMDEFKSLNAEIVTIYLGWNSLFDANQMFGMPARQTYFFSIRMLTAATARLVRHWKGPQGSALAAYQQIRVADPNDPALTRVDQSVPSFVSEIETIGRLFHEGGSKVYLITLPGLYETGLPPSTDALQKGHLPPYTTNPFVLARLTTNFNNTIRQLASENGWGLIDLEKWSIVAFNPRERYFLDSVHLSEDGQQMVGGAIAEALLHDAGGVLQPTIEDRFESKH